MEQRIDHKQFSFGVEKQVVTLAALHASFNIPNYGSFGPTLSPNSGASQKPVTMTLDGGLVRVTPVGKNIEVCIPLSNFIYLVLAK